MAFSVRRGENLIILVFLGGTLFWWPLLGMGNLIASLDFLLPVALIPHGLINHGRDILEDWPQFWLLFFATVMEGLDAVERRQYLWFWPLKESIGRTNRLMDCLCIDWNFWKMITSPFWKCVQNTIFNASFGKRHPLFSASSFFLLCAVRAYTNAHYIQVNMVIWLFSQGWRYVIIRNRSMMRHLNRFLAQGEGDFNKNVSKIRMAGGLPKEGDVEAWMWLATLSTALVHHTLSFSFSHHRKFFRN